MQEAQDLFVRGRGGVRISRIGSAEMHLAGPDAPVDPMLDRDERLEKPVTGNG